MFDYEVIIIGGGPAGLTAGIYTARARRQVILLGEHIFDGPLANLELVENFPGFASGVAGAELIAGMAGQAMNAGLPLQESRVTGIEKIDGGCRVVLEDGSRLTAGGLIIASGTHHRKLGIPGEDNLQEKGVFACAFCDGPKFKDQAVAVCGGGDAGVTEAIFMTKLASKVILIEMMPFLTASAVLQERLRENPKVEIRTGTRVNTINGQAKVESISVTDGTGKTETLPVNGVLVDIGLIPNTGFINGTVELAKSGHILVDEKMETNVPGIFAAGDVRCGSPNQIVTATGDGGTAAIFLERMLQQQK